MFLNQTHSLLLALADQELQEGVELQKRGPIHNHIQREAWLDDIASRRKLQSSGQRIWRAVLMLPSALVWWSLPGGRGLRRPVRGWRAT